MRLPRELFDWNDGPDEAPIPLDEGKFEDVGEEVVDLPAAVVEDAEVVVREAQDAIAREDTDPAIPLSLLATHITRLVAPPPATDGKKVQRSGGIRGRLPKAVLVVAACAVAFTHGWHQGSMAPDPQAASQSSIAQGSLSLCEPNHCPREPKDQRWKEVQHR